MTQSPAAPAGPLASASTAAYLRDHEVREMLFLIVCALVDATDQVELLHLSDAEGTAFQVRTAPADIGKLIGKSGRTARAIRTILNGSAVRNHRRYTLDIAHSPGHTPADEGTHDGE
jgi:predicted RNA-binding protein YlqC (UPF0109 family)